MDRSRIGFVLSTLAICLQVVVCTIGGRICLESTTLAGDEHCLSACCSEDAAQHSAAVATATTIISPLQPIDSGCCLDQSSETMASTLHAPNIRLAVSTTPVLVTPMARVEQFDAPAAAWRAARLTAAAKPPPALGVIQSVRLQL